MANNTIRKEDVEVALQSVIDPHIGIDIVTLGFIYNIDITEETKVDILMTLTTPACPMGGSIESMMKDAVYAIGATEVIVEKTFDPPWEPPQALRDMMRPPEETQQ